MFPAFCSRKYLYRSDEDTTDSPRYTSVGLFPVFYVGWKIAHKTKILKPTDIDLRHNLAPIEEYERNYVPQPPAYVLLTDSRIMKC
jgi:amino acid permease